MEGLIQIGIVVLIVLGGVVLALLIPVLTRLRRTVTEAERTLVELRGQTVPVLQGLPPAINQLQQILESTDTILSETRTALMPAVKDAGSTLSEDVIPSLREALVTVRHLIKVSQSLVEKIERIERVLSVVDVVTHPQKVAKAVKSVASSPVSRPSVWIEALKKGYAVLKGAQPTETPQPSEGSEDTGAPPVGEEPETQRGGENHVGQ
ncbi:MAG: hypothetical protein ACUVSE_13425 [Armatimonadota bacterium]